MTYPKSKTEIVKTILAAIGDDPDNPWKNIPVDKLVFSWFISGRTGSGLRLTVEGSKAFAYAQIAHYDFPVDNSGQVWTAAAWERYSVFVNKKLHCPYFISSSIEQQHLRVWVYDHRIAMMLGLFGSLTEYVESVIA